MNFEKYLLFGYSILRDVERLSTCYKTKVGAVLFKDGRVVATGWNGTLSGQPHCQDDPRLHKTYEVHSEANCIAFAAKLGIATAGTDLFVSVTPCAECAKFLVQAGIRRVFARHIYSNDRRGVDILLRAGVSVYVWRQLSSYAYAPSERPVESQPRGAL